MSGVLTHLLMKIKLPVVALFCNQFIMSALLYNLTILHDNDLIKRDRLYDSMGDENGSFAIQISSKIF